MQKLVGNKLYVFDLTPYEITEQTDAQVIYVQQECIDGYKELNASLADKIESFNQFIICVAKPEWAQDEPTPTENHTVTLTGNNLTGAEVEVHINNEIVEFESSYTVSDGATFELYLTDAAENYELASENMSYSPSPDPRYYTTVTDDMNIVLNYSSSPSVGYDIILSGSDAEEIGVCGIVNGQPDWLNGTWNSENNTKTIHYSAGLPFEIDERSCSVDSITPELQESSEPLWGVGTCWIMPESDVTAVVSPLAQTHSVSINGTDILNNINVYFDNVQQTVESQYQDVAENTVIDIYPTETVSNYTLVGGATWDTDHWTATMPDQDLTIEINYAEPVQASPTVKVQYEVRANSNPVNIFTWPDQSFDSNVPDQMFVDGAEETVSNTYQFDSTGTHTIEYVFDDGCFDIGLTDIDPSYTSIRVVSVEVNDAIISVADYAWGVEAPSEPGASDMSPLPLTYLPIVPPTINSTGASDVEAPGATVYVPADSVTDYQQASVWSDIAQLIQAIVPA